MSTDYTAEALAAITDPEDLLDVITEMADERDRLAALVKSEALRAISLGARQMGTAAAANISRPTLNEWIEEDASTASV